MSGADPFGYYARKAAREAPLRAAAPYRIVSSGKVYSDFDALEAGLRAYGLALDPGNLSAGRLAIIDSFSGAICDWLASGKAARHD